MNVIQEKGKELKITIGLLIAAILVFNLMCAVLCLVQENTNILAMCVALIFVIFGLSVSVGLFYLNQQAVVFAQLFCLMAILFSIMLSGLAKSWHLSNAIPIVAFALWCLHVTRKYKHRFT